MSCVVTLDPESKVIAHGVAVFLRTGLIAVASFVGVPPMAPCLAAFV